jgi:hypothetical protein
LTLVAPKIPWRDSKFEGLFCLDTSASIGRMRFPQNSKTVTRQELYELVWKEPVVKVAKRFEVSDVAVAKACRRHQIPLPGRSHWARLAAGQQISRTPLPEVKEQPLQHITFLGAPASPARKVGEPPEITFERKAENKIIVQESPSELHPLARMTLVVLSREEPGTSGLVNPTAETLDVHVSRAMISRAIALLDAFIKAAEERGHSVTLSPHVGSRSPYNWWTPGWIPWTHTRVTLFGETLGFELRELCDQVPHIPTKEEQRKIARGNA